MNDEMSQRIIIRRRSSVFYHCGNVSFFSTPLCGCKPNSFSLSATDLFLPLNQYRAVLSRGRREIIQLKLYMFLNETKILTVSYKAPIFFLNVSYLPLPTFICVCPLIFSSRCSLNKEPRIVILLKLVERVKEDLPPAGL